MMAKALLIDDDPQICEAVGNILESLGHTYVRAGSQEEARAVLDGGPYAYVLLDLEIPVRANGGFARLVNGENLLGEIRAHPATRQTPVIVMTAHGTDGPTLAVRLMKKGAVDFVNKPFDGDKLDRAILETLNRGVPASTPAGPPSSGSRPFAGGELVLGDDRIELCGTTIIEKSNRGHGWKILVALTEVGEHGRRRSFSASRLAKHLGGRIGDNTIIQGIRSLRRRISESLAAVGIECGESDVILSGSHGYRLAATVTVQRATRVPNEGATAVGPQATTLGTGANGDGTGDTDLNERQIWVLDELRRAGRLCRCDVEKQCDCSERTAKRDLAALRAKGLIEYVDTPRPGHYRLTRSA
ncbi:MAG: response regulator [Actinobacteria bacterium]|nr:response regulator [Actinomycetota bacterium]